MSLPAADLERAWGAFVDLSKPFYASGPGGEVVAGPGWFAALSHEQNAELNICGLTPSATATSAQALVESVNADLPALVFVSSHADPAAGGFLNSTGFAIASVTEPLMCATHPPEPVPTPLRVEPAAGTSDLSTGLSLTAEAHHVARAMLENSIRHAALLGSARMWLAWDGNEPISVVWITRLDRWLGVMEMMTPERHQRRGAGRALLTRALAEEWAADTEFAVLISTPAGRRLYESLGFEAIDEIRTRYRGLNDDVLGAIGQPSG